MVLGTVLCALLALNACGPYGLDREAQTAANDYLDKALSNCDGHRVSHDIFSPFPFNSHITEYEGLSVQVAPDQLTNAQSLNGFEWVGTMWIRCSAHRNRAGQGWTEWENGCSNGPNGGMANGIAFKKRNGHWYLSAPAFGFLVVIPVFPVTVDFPIEQFRGQSVDCASLSSTSSSNATSANSGHQDSASEAFTGQTQRCSAPRPGPVAGMPDTVRSILDRQYPCWVKPAISDYDLRTCKQPNPDFQYWFVWGDFDGDGNKDYATQFKEADKNYILVFFNRGNQFVPTVVDPDNKLGWPLLGAAHKGETIPDLHEGPNGALISNQRTLKADALLGIGCEKEAVAYIYSGSQFERVFIAD
jgi:hypothetical protein